MPKSKLTSSSIALNQFTQILPLSEFHETILNKLDGSSDDYILSLRKSRFTSKRISREVAKFLENFKKPVFFLDVVVQHSEKYELNSNDFLSDIYPIINTFINSGILVYSEDWYSSKNHPKYSEGEIINGLKIINCIQFLGDTEVYCTQDTEGNFIVLKTVCEDQSISLINRLKNESSILKKLNKQNNKFCPEFLKLDLKVENPYMTLKWCKGQTLFRKINENKLTLIDKQSIILGLINAYSSINKAGIIHGDVHPKNIIIDDANFVKLIDFGESVELENPNTNRESERAGVVFYYEPELAKCYLENKEPINANPAGEQYNLAVLIYLTFTGSMPIALSLELNTALNQIAYDAPRSFREFNLNYPELEAIIMRALNKVPEKRYKNFEDFCINIKYHIKNLRQVRNKDSFSMKENSLNEINNINFQNIFSNFTEKYGLNSSNIDQNLDSSPTVSLFHGATGIAYTFFRAGCLFKNSELVATADIWINKAKKEQFNHDAFENSAIGHLYKNMGTYSLFHNNSGIWVIDALIQFVKGNIDGCINSINSFLNVSDNCFKDLKENKIQKDYIFDVTQGPGSILIGFSLLYPICQSIQGFPIEKLLNPIKNFSAVLINKLKLKLSLIDTDNNAYLGFAHGYTGMLFSLINLNNLIKFENQNLIQDCLNVIESLAIKSGDMLSVSWPLRVRNNNNIALTGWCHGSVGYILLWFTSAKIYKNEKHIKIAEKAGEHIWNSHGHSGPSLCCGLAGESLSLFLLGQLTGKEKWYDRGFYLAKRALNTQTNFEISNSLFQGNVGMALLACEALNPKNSLWPLFQPPINGIDN